MRSKLTQFARLGGIHVRRDVAMEWFVGSGLIVVTLVAALLSGSNFWIQSFLLVDIYIIVAISLNILRGEAGQVCFGQGAIMGAGAYGAAMASGVYDLPAIVSVGVGIGCSILAGFLLSLPALRVQGFYLGFVTLAASVVFVELLVAFNDFTNAVTGVSAMDLGIASDPIVGGVSWPMIAVLLAGLGALAVNAVVSSSRLGWRFRFAAESPEAAQTIGIRPGRTRVAAFVLASILAGIAGVLYVSVMGFVSSGAFPLTISILFYFAMVVGGQGTILGPILGVYLLYLVPDVLLTGLNEYRLLIYGLAAFIVVLFLPGGIVGSLRQLVRSRGRRRTVINVPMSELLSFVGDGGVHSPGSGVAPGESILFVNGATKRFGNVLALNDVQVDFRAGEIHAIVGPNGSGKTTLLNLLSGLIRVDEGSVLFGGRDITGLGAEDRGKLGIGRTFQTPRVVEELSVRENLELGAARRRAGRALRPDVANASVSQLDHAHRRILELARVILIDPEVVLLDEPAAGLAPDDRVALMQCLVDLREQGLAIVLVEHDLSLVWGYSDTVTVMEEGAVVASGSPSEVMETSGGRSLFGVSEAGDATRSN